LPTNRAAARWSWHNPAASAGLQRRRESDMSSQSLPQSGQRVSEPTWNGYRREDFRVAGRDCILVSPVAALPERPWIWRTEFFDAFPCVDLSLLEAGFHLAYMNVQNLYGAPTSLDLLDQFYERLRQDRGLAARTVVEGFSRGALFALNWSARHPSRIACLYLDAPVCDFKSWPGGKGRARGSADDWQLLQKAYGFADEAEAIAYGGNPLDNLEPLAQARVPIIAVYGEADVDLPPEENILVLQERYARLGGEISVIPKPGVGHHPHSLPDPEPVLQFILARTS
jgi:pimeloyl-ACP methyl ester carboxylesterase